MPSCASARPTCVGCSFATLPPAFGQEIVAAAVGVDRGEQPQAFDRLGETPKAQEGAFLLDQGGRVDLACRIVEGHDQVEGRLLSQPRVARAVLEQHHPRQRPARPPLAMRPALARRRDQPRPMQHPLRPRIGERELV